MGRLPILVVLMAATVYASVPVEYHYHGQPGKHHPLRSLKKGNLKCIFCVLKHLSTCIKYSQQYSKTHFLGKSPTV